MVNRYFVQLERRGLSLQGLSPAQLVVAAPGRGAANQRRLSRVLVGEGGRDPDHPVITEIRRVIVDPKAVTEAQTAGGSAVDTRAQPTMHSPHALDITDRHWQPCLLQHPQLEAQVMKAWQIQWPRPS